MPYIEVKLAKQASRKQERIFTKEENSLNMEHMFMLFLKQE